MFVCLCGYTLRCEFLRSCVFFPLIQPLFNRFARFWFTIFFLQIMLLIRFMLMRTISIVVPCLFFPLFCSVGFFFFSLLSMLRFIFFSFWKSCVSIEYWKTHIHTNTYTQNVDTLTRLFKQTKVDISIRMQFSTSFSHNTVFTPYSCEISVIIRRIWFIFRRFVFIALCGQALLIMA